MARHPGNDGQSLAFFAITVITISFIVGLLVTAIGGPRLMTLEETVASIFDAAEAGDPEPSWRHDPDCPAPTAEQLATGTQFLSGWIFRVDDVRVTGNYGTVVATGVSPDGQHDTSTTNWHLASDGRWMMIPDGKC